MTVRQKLKYYSAIWDPYQATYIKAIEMIQRRGSEICKNVKSPSSDAKPSITAALD